jgi:hypothetical protein
MAWLLAAASASAQTTTVTASWEANYDAQTAGYLVSYGTSPGSYQWSVDAGSQTSTRITVNQGSRYYFIVRAYNSSAVLSPPSNESSIDLGGGATTPTAQITATLQSATSALVSWTTTNAVSATINGVAVGLSGSTTVAISGTTTFTIVATGSSGATATQSATVTVTQPAPAVTITASLQNPTTALVTWTTANATSAVINGTAVSLSGSASVAVSGTTTFTLVATGPGGTTTRSATVTATAPAPTATLTASMQSATTALVTWATTNATTVTLSGAAVAASGSRTVTVSAQTTFTLVATGAGGTVTRNATVTPSTAAPPYQPTNMLGSVSGARVTLSWRAPTSGPAPDRYLLYVGTASGATNISNGLNVGNVLSVAGDLPRGRYYARTRAANVSGVSGFSNETSFWIGKRLISPSGFTVQWRGSTAVLTWTQPAGDATTDTPTAYVLEAGTAPGRADVASVRLGNVRSFSAPIPGGTYYVRVRAANEYGESDPTEDIALTAPGAPGAPRQLVASGSSVTVTLRWQAPADGGSPTAYQIEAGSAPGLSDIAVAQIGNVTSFSSPIPPGTYYIRVKALNGRGAGAASNEVIVRR